MPDLPDIQRCAYHTRVCDTYTHAGIEVHSEIYYEVIDTTLGSALSFQFTPCSSSTSERTAHHRGFGWNFSSLAIRERNDQYPPTVPCAGADD